MSSLKSLTLARIVGGSLDLKVGGFTAIPMGRPIVTTGTSAVAAAVRFPEGLGDLPRARFGSTFNIHPITKTTLDQFWAAAPKLADKGEIGAAKLTKKTKVYTTENEVKDKDYERNDNADIFEAILDWPENTYIPGPDDKLPKYKSQTRTILSLIPRNPTTTQFLTRGFELFYTVFWYFWSLGPMQTLAIGRPSSPKKKQ
ncbi:hypothetical protein J1614_001502 [Plenodomus biglobosus]|nr:hypothetical protein J1614_001502 [Plenodomus biglobosus]